MVVLGRWAVSYERGTPVHTHLWFCFWYVLVLRMVLTLL